MAVQLEKRDLDKVARSLGKSGKPAPDWVTSDPALNAAYREAAGLPPADVVDQVDDAAPAPKPAKAPAKRPAAPKQKAGRPASAGARKPPGRAPAPRSTPGRRSRTLGGRARDLVSHPATLGGDGGGLMLAVFLYPLVLATIQHGAGGAGAWLRAKFLNRGKGDSTTPFYRSENGPGATGFPPNSTPPGTGRLPNGQKIPGTPPDLPPGSSQS